MALLAAVAATSKVSQAKVKVSQCMDAKHEIQMKVMDAQMWRESDQHT